VFGTVRRALVCLVLGVLTLLSSVHGLRAQAGYDRPGGDYSSFIVRAADPAACSARCDREGRCRAWSFSYPTPTGARAVCWLKSTVPPRKESPCCVSGVKGGGVIEPRGSATEFGIDRLGGDYRNFESKPEPNGEACAAACQADARCRAWTYQRPGYAGPAARCWLKSRVTTPRKTPCCVSGVVR
jgi:hypothetical protein